MDATANKFVRSQSIGNQVKLHIRACRMIILPVLVREIWCSYLPCQKMLPSLPMPPFTMPVCSRPSPMSSTKDDEWVARPSV